LKLLNLNDSDLPKSDYLNESPDFPVSISDLPNIGVFGLPELPNESTSKTGNHRFVPYAWFLVAWTKFEKVVLFRQSRRHVHHDPSEQVTHTSQLPINPKALIGDLTHSSANSSV
jgi:hypothetical protein